MGRSSGRLTSVLRPAQYTSSRRRASTRARAWLNSRSRPVPTESPARRRMRPKATTPPSGSTATGETQQLRQPLVADALLVLLVLEDGAERGIGRLLVEVVDLEDGESRSP